MQPWGHPYPCWVQTSQCGCFKVTHAPAHNMSPSALSLSLNIHLVAQDKFLWNFVIGYSGKGTDNVYCLLGKFLPTLAHSYLIHKWKSKLLITVDSLCQYLYG